MKFQTVDELEECYNILIKAYGGYYMLLEHAIKRDEMVIIMIGDAYFDPVLTLLILCKKLILDLSVGYYGSEIDKLTIFGADLPALRQLAKLSEWSDWKNIKDILKDRKDRECKKPKMSSAHIILSGQIIAIADWKAYWNLQGKDGPSDGWEIPTPEELYQAINK